MPTQNFGWVAADNPVPAMIDAEAARQGVDRNLAHTVAQMESNYSPDARSGAGAMGVMQLMPGTARDLGVSDPMDPAQNIRGGIRYLAQLSKKYGSDDTSRILAAYNAGPGAVDNAGGVPKYPETVNYVTTGKRKISQMAPATDPFGFVPDESVPSTPQTRRQPSVEVLPPLTEPPGEKPAPPEKTVKGFLDNVTTGLGRILEPLADPEGTLENVTNLIQGMSEKSGFSPVMGQPKQQVVDAIVNLYKHRYGSLEGFKDAFYNDPVGIAGDVATVFSGAGLGYKAAQDFLEASGITQHAADIAKIAPEAAAGTTAAGAAQTGAAQTRMQAGVQGAVDAISKRYMEVVKGGMEKAPSGILGGPHGMLGAAKYGASKKALEILKDGWQAATKAYDAPAAASAEEATTAATPAVAKTAGQVYAESQGHAWADLSANDRQLMEQIAQAHANVAAQAPPQPPPRTTPPAVSAEPLKPGDVVQWQSQGVDQFQTPRSIRGFSPDGKYAFVEGTNTGIPVEQLMRAEAPGAPSAAPPLTPQELTELETGRPPSRQSEAAQQAAAETLATVQAEAPAPAAPATPQAAPVAPEAPAPVPQPPAAPIAPSAPQAAKPAAEGLPPETAQMTPEDAEEVFQQQKARIEEGMTPAQEPQAGVRLEPLPEEVPPHYQAIQQVEGTSAATRAFLKDKRIADYLLGKGITPEQFEAMPLEQQNQLITKAPAASAKGKNRPFLPKPAGAGPRAVGRYADEGIRDIVNTMRWRQAQK